MSEVEQTVAEDEPEEEDESVPEEEEGEEAGEEPVGGVISKDEAIKIAEEQGGSREEAEEQPKQENELKVVINLKGENAMLGVQSTDCDPVYTTLKGNLAAALKRVPKLVAEAKKKWDSNPRYPKANLPAPAPAPTPARTPADPKAKPAQPSFF